MTKIILDLSNPKKPTFKAENVNANKIYQATLDGITVMCSIIDQITDDAELIEAIKLSWIMVIEQWTKWTEVDHLKIVKR